MEGDWLHKSMNSRRESWRAILETGYHNPSSEFFMAFHMQNIPTSFRGLQTLISSKHQLKVQTLISSKPGLVPWVELIFIWRPGSLSAHLSYPQIQYIMVAHEWKNYSVGRRDPLESLLSLCESRSVVSNSLWPHGLHRLYNPWNSPGQNTGVGNLSFLKGIFPTQGLNQGL